MAHRAELGVGRVAAMETTAITTKPTKRKKPMSTKIENKLRDSITDTFEVDLVMMSPELAREALATMVANRPVTMAHVRNLAGAIKSGEWRGSDTRELIKFSGDGRLIDGQHRLMAIIEAGVPIVVGVTFGCDPSVFDVLDTGRARSGGDVLALTGHAQGNFLAASLRVAYAVTHNGFGRMLNRASNAQIMQMIEEFPAMPESMAAVAGVPRFIPQSVAAGLHYVMSQIDSEKATVFFDGLATGQGLPAGSPILVLRNKLLTPKTQRSSTTRSTVAALTIKAWNAWIKGDRIYMLRWTGIGKNAESFPKIEAPKGDK